MPLDIILFAVLAAFLVHRLRSVLGTRPDDDQSPVNPFVMPPKEEMEKDKKEAQSSMPANVVDMKPGEVFTAGEETTPLGKNLQKIMQADRYFSPESFTSGAGDAFIMIVRAYAEGDRDTLKPLLSDEIYQAFDEAITEREKAGHRQFTDVHSIREAEIIDAKMQRKMAYVTVRFRVEESNYTLDKKDKVVAGHDNRISEVNDIWTFMRDTKSSDPNWLLVETRSLE